MALQLIREPINVPGFAPEGLGMNPPVAIE
jgi:hypothetical protein